MNTLNMVYTLLFSSSKCSLFHNSNVFGSCIIHILYTGCVNLKNNSGAKRLRILVVCQRQKTGCLCHINSLLRSSTTVYFRMILKKSRHLIHWREECMTRLTTTIEMQKITHLELLSNEGN